MGRAHASQGLHLGVERAPVVIAVDRVPDRLDLLDQQRLGGLVLPIGMGIAKRRVALQRCTEIALRSPAPAADKANLLME